MAKKLLLLLLFCIATISSFSQDYVMASGSTGQCKYRVVLSKIGSSDYWYLYIDGNGAMGNYTPTSPAPWKGYGTARPIISEGVTTIGNFAFYGRTLTSINLPTSIVSIGINAFSDCTNLTSVILPENVTSIGSNAFSGCTKLRSITIPNGVTSIGDNAFAKCTGLSSLTIGNNLSSLNGFDFSHYTHLTTIDISNENAHYTSEEGILFNKEQTTLIRYPARKEGSSYRIPNSVTHIENGAFSNCINLTSIIIPNSVTSIGDKAFLDCTNLIDITLPNNITAIADNMFQNCMKLTTILLPNEITSIGKGAFSGCINLSNITIPDKVTAIADNTFHNCPQLTDFTISNTIISIGNSAFSGCTGLTSITIPGNIVNMGSNVFSDCINLTTANYNAVNCSMTGYSGIFPNCNNLNEINIGNEVLSIPENAFYGCTGLTSLTIPKNITSIGNHAFYNCSNLNTLFFNAINCNAANAGWTNINEVVIGNEVKIIPDYTFLNCTNLSSIILPNGITSIGTEAFRGCYQLKDIFVSWNIPLSVVESSFTGLSCSGITLHVPGGTAATYRKDRVWNMFNIPVELSELPCSEPLAYGSSRGFVWSICNNTLEIKGIGSIPDYTSGDTPWYSYRTSIKELMIGEDISSIGNYAFSGCNSLNYVIIPKSVATLGDYAFAGCSELSSITFQTEERIIVNGEGEEYEEYKVIVGIKSIGSYAFSGCPSLTSITIPQSVINILADTFENNSLSAIQVDTNNPNFTSEDGILLNKTKTSLIRFPSKKGNLGNILNSVTSIGEYAFSGCSHFTSIIIPNTITRIGRYAFKGCINLESMTLPLTPIREFNYFFGELFYSVNRITFSSISTYSIANYKQTHYVYNSCRYCYNGGRGYENFYYYVPSSLKSIYITDEADIPDNFFQNMNLKTVSIPAVKSIGNSAFSGCTLLKSISIPNSVTSIGNGAFNSCPLEEVITPIVSINAGFFTSRLQKLTITNVCTSISPGILSSCANLEELTLPFIGTNIYATGEAAVLGTLFGTSTSTTAITQYYGENSSDYGKFAIPTTLKKLTITRPAIQIGYGALYNCNMLKEVTIGSSITGLGQKALYGCNGLEHIYAHRALPPSANANTFEEVNKFACKLYVPADSKQYYSHDAAIGWKDFFFIEEESAIQIVALPVPFYGGEITGITQYNYEDEAIVTAHPNMKYNFKCWMEGENLVSTSTEYRFTVNGSRTLYAVFTPRENADENIQIRTETNSAFISWTAIEDAINYTLIIYSNKNRTQEITRLQLDAAGNVFRNTSRNLSCDIPDLELATTYYYSLLSYDANNYTLTISDGDFTTSAKVGIDTLFVNSLLHIFPNPVTESFTISNITESVEVKLFNISGKIVLQCTVAPNEAVSMAHLSEGIYILRVADKTVKIIKEK